MRSKPDRPVDRRLNLSRLCIKTDAFWQPLSIYMLVFGGLATHHRTAESSCHDQDDMPSFEGHSHCCVTLQSNTTQTSTPELTRPPLIRCIQLQPGSSPHQRPLANTLLQNQSLLLTGSNPASCQLSSLQCLEYHEHLKTELQPLRPPL